MFKLKLLSNIHPACRNDTNGIKPGSYPKMTDKHADEYSKHFSRQNQRIREVILVPDSPWKEAIFIGVCTSRGIAIEF